MPNLKIGLEIHAQLLTRNKLFSGPVGLVSPLDVATPGHLPILDRECVDKALKAATLLNCTINKVSRFDRKHYFYKDLPLGYQITQFYHPLAISGNFMNVRINRLQLEQDTAKVKNGIVDYRRAGSALIEIVTGAEDLRDSKQAEGFCRALSALLKEHAVSSGCLEDGSLRVDVNVSLHRGSETLVPRVEVKNIMGFRFIAKAIEEMKRIQEDSVVGLCPVPSGTWMFDQKRQTVRHVREKTRREEYQYFPDPELNPLILSETELKMLQK
jgi:aspartyl-tRNA(Asn)/glutamyl-tRNA(Gln) amidotransferase subunit B